MGLATLALGLGLTFAPLQGAVADLPSNADAAEAPVVMLLGVYHFDNPGLDVVNIAADDVLSERRQGEIGVLNQAVARFAPTIVAVEETAASVALDSPTFAAWREGGRRDSRNERDQLGFRLADMTGARVVAVDVEAPLPFGPLMQAAEATAPDVLARVMATVQADADAASRALQTGTISDALKVLNGPDSLKRSEALYYIPLAVSPDGGATLPGVAVASAWYERNLRICARLLSVAKPGERVLVIYGSSHLPLLRQCLSAAGARLEDPIPYLPAAR